MTIICKFRQQGAIIMLNVKASEAQKDIYRKLLVNETMLKARLTAS
jgi:hypothetical protein